MKNTWKSIYIYYIYIYIFDIIKLYLPNFFFFFFFLAPEILNNQRYGKPVDLWATGVICNINIYKYILIHI